MSIVFLAQDSHHQHIDWSPVAQPMLPEDPFTHESTLFEAPYCPFVIFISREEDATQIEFFEGVLEQPPNCEPTIAATLDIFFAKTHVDFSSTLEGVDVHQLNLADWSTILRYARFC